MPADALKKRTRQKTYRFKKGQRLYLDDIYDIQSLAGGNWWANCDSLTNEITEGGDGVLITKNITIITKWTVEE